MLKLHKQIDAECPLLELSKLHHTVRAYDGIQQILQIDTKHQITFKSKLTYPALTVKSLIYQCKPAYFIIYLNRIETYEGGLISDSNSKSQFTGTIDCLSDNVLATKYHHNYKKYSINYIHDGYKKILKLCDHPIKETFFHPYHPQIIYSFNSNIQYFDIQNPQKETQLFKKSYILKDTHNIYFLTNNLENKSKEQYDCGIFDFRTGKNSDSWVSRQIPIKVQSFSKNLIVATQSSLEIYDIRKLLKPYERESCRNIKDFLYEPNINKLYVSSDQRLKIFNCNY